LLPDSTSRISPTRPFSGSGRERNTPKTAAASVDEMIAPSNSDWRQSSPATVTPNTPTSPTAISTPRVASESPRASTGRTAVQRVSKPPA